MYFLGIGPDGEYFKVALVKLKGRKLSLVLLQEFQKDLLDLDQLKKKIAAETGVAADKIGCISALRPDEVFVRHIDLPFKSNNKIFKALPFQMETLLPFDEASAITVPLIQKEAKGSKITLFSFLKETLQKHVQEIGAFGFDPDVVTCIPMALHRFAKWYAEEAPSPLIFHFGWENSHVVYIQEGVLKKSLTIKIGFKQLIDAVKMQYPSSTEIDFQFIKEELVRNAERKNPSDRPLQEIIENFNKQIHRVMEFLSRKEEIALSQGILFTGYADVIKLFIPMIPELDRPQIEIALNLLCPKEKTALFAIEIGLALDALAQDKSSLQFRLGSFIAKKEWDKLQSKVRRTVIASAICSVALFSSLAFTYVKKQESLKQRFNHVASLAGKRASDYPGMQKTVFYLDETDREIKDLSKKVEIQEMEKFYLQEAPYFAAYLEKILKAGEDLIEIQGLSYMLEDYPHIGNPAGEYRIFVELTFVSKVEEGGEKFMDTILPEIKGLIQEKTIFTREKDGYKLTFYVQEK